MYIFRHPLTAILGLSVLLTSGPSAAKMFSINPKDTDPGVVLEAEYDYYGQSGKLSKLRGLHLRPPYELPVSTVAIIDNLNEKLKKNKQTAPDVFITDRIQWGRYQLFSVLRPMANGQQISEPFPVICESKYRCRVDEFFDSHLNEEQQNLMKWIRYHLKTRHAEAILNDQQRFKTTQSFKLFSVFDPRGDASPAINFWLNLQPYPRKKPILIDASGVTQNSSRLELKTIANFIQKTHALDEKEVNANSDTFNLLLGTELNDLFAGQFTYPFTSMTLNYSGKPVYERKDLSGVELTNRARSWNSITPLGYINSGSVRYVAFSVNDQPENVRIIPVQCDGRLCETLSAELMRTNELRLLNHPLIINEVARYLNGTK